jgi:hypothetical protein
MFVNWRLSNADNGYFAHSTVLPDCDYDNYNFCISQELSGNAICLLE